MMGSVVQQGWTHSPICRPEMGACRKGILAGQVGRKREGGREMRSRYSKGKHGQVAAER